MSAPGVQLFATCLGDLVFPEAVADADVLLREAGFEVELPRRQVCCGQPAFNSGHRKAARRIARGFVKAFSRSLPVVIPSGSCATMVAHYLPELVGEEPYEVWELSAFLDRHGLEPDRHGARVGEARGGDVEDLEPGVRNVAREQLRAVRRQRERPHGPALEQGVVDLRPGAARERHAAVRVQRGDAGGRDGRL